jgi:3'-5' exoribonuclease
MEKIWVKDVKEGERIKSAFLVARKAIPTAKSGKTYLAVTLQDKTGELEARAFEKVEEIAPRFEEKDHVEIEGQIGLFQGKPQLRIESVQKLDAATAGLDPAEFIFVPPPEPKKPEKTGFSDAEETLWRELQGLVEAVVDPNVKSLIKAFLGDEDVVHRLRRAPAAKSVHHAYHGGLLEHTVSCLKLAHRLADHYPQVDRDLMVAGAFFHDLGKIRELAFERQVEYSDEGRLVGHLVMTAQWIHDKARRVGIPRELEQHVTHIVLSHHGRLEYGSPRVPQTLEALLIHYLDDLDSRVNSWLNLMGGQGGNRRWTDASNLYQQHIWRGTLPTVQAEKKGPAPEIMTPVIYVPRESQPAPAGSQKQKAKQRRNGQAPRPRPEGTMETPAEGAAPKTDTVAQPVERTDRPERTDHSERSERSDRPARSDRPDRGPRTGPGDRPRRYMGPRLPGDKGPQPRTDKGKTGALTHNPFAALAAKVEGGKEEKPAEVEAAQPAEVAEVPAPAPVVSAEPPSAPAETPAPAPQEGAVQSPQESAEPAAP